MVLLGTFIILETRVLADLVDGSVMFSGLPLTVAPPHDRRHDPLNPGQGPISISRAR